MSESHPLPARRERKTQAEKLYPDSFAAFDQFSSNVPSHLLLDERDAFTPGNLTAVKEESPLTTGRLLNLSEPLADATTTQSLIMALQSTGTAPNRNIVVIPGKRRALQQADTTSTHRLPHRWRWGLTLGVLTFFLAFSIFTLTPLSADQANMPLVGGLLQFVHIQEKNLGIFSAHQTPATATPKLSTMMLPKSQYVAIAQQDAMDAGIPPDYFVRQINAESGFNPNAISPAGAVGIAQFLPSTAAGLGVNPYDPISALRGAAKYMASYYNTYGKDYAKALAAYNAGGGTVDRAVRLGGASWMNYLPAETRHYIYIIMGI